MLKRLLLLAIICVAFAMDGYNQNFREWVGSGDWDVNSNWNPNGYIYAQLEWKGNGSTTSNNDIDPASQWRLYFSGGTSYNLTGFPVQLFDNNGDNSWVLSDATVDQDIDLDVHFLDAGTRSAWITTRNTGGLNFENLEIGGGVTELRFSGTNIAGDIFINGSISATSKPIIIGRDDANTLQGNTRVTFASPSSYSGTTTISAGILTIDDDQALGFAGDVTTVESGAVLALNDGGSGIYNEQLILNGTGISNDGALQKYDSGSDDYRGQITLGSDARINIENGSTLIFRDAAFDFAGNTLYIGGSQNFEFGPNTEFVNATRVGGDGTIFKDGTGVLFLRASEGSPLTEIEGDIILVNGEIRQTTNDPFSTAGTLILRGGTYRSNGGTDRTVEKPTRVEGNFTIGHSGGGSITFSAPMDLDGGIRTLSMENANVISGEISNGSLIKDGIGTLTLSGSTSNNLGIDSEVNDGTLVLNKTAGFRATDNLAINSGGTVRTDADNQWGTTTPPFIQVNGGILDLNGTNQRIALAGTAAGQITLGGGNLTIENGLTDTFQGVISGTGSVTKEGSGTEILSGANTYSGTTTITEGTLQLGSNDALPSSSPIILNGGTLRSTNATGAASLGTINLAENSTIDLGGTSEDLTFANSSSITWNSDATLTILGWLGTEGQSGTSSQIFVSNPGDLTEDQLLRFQFAGFDFGAEILPTGEIVPKQQNVNRFDNFNRAQGNILGTPSGGNPGSWIEMENPPTNCTNGPFIEINSDGQLQLSRGSGGTCTASADLKTAAFDITGEYASTFRDAGGELVWYFNFRHTDSDPSSSNRSGFILGSSEADFTSSTAVGYAVMMGDNSPATDEFTLIHFDSGIPTTSNFSSNEIIAINNPDTDSHYSIRVAFDPCSDTWSMTVRNDGTSFRDPASITTIGSSEVDVTHVDQNLPFIGAYRIHSTTGTRSTLIDNVYIPKEPIATIEYVWSGVNGDYQIATNWSPTRDCNRGGDILRFNSGSAVVVSNVPDETIGQLIVENNTSVTLRDVADPGPNANHSTLTLTGRNTGTDLFVENGSSLIFDPPNTVSGHAMVISLSSGATGEISGNLDFIRSSGTVGPVHKLLGTDFESIRITSTGQVRAFQLSSASNEHPFGRLLPNETVIFESGSVYESYSGNNPFGSDQPDSKVRFESGSVYRHIGNHDFSYSGRQYADFEYSNNTASPTLTVTTGTTNGWNVENLRILNGTLIINPTFSVSSFLLNISQDLEIAGGAVFNYVPSEPLPGAASTLRFNGSGQQAILGDGTFTLNDRVTVEVDNSYTGFGYGLEIRRDLDLFSDFLIQNGVVEGTGISINMNGTNSVLQVNDDLNGTNVGSGRDIDLNIASGLTTLIGNTSNCDFLNIAVQPTASLALERGIEVIFGSFNVNTNADLIIESGGFIDDVHPQWKAPQYLTGSKLIYNVGTSYGRGNEWMEDSTGTQEGCPDQVIIQNGTILFTDNTNPLECRGSMAVGSAQGIGTLDVNSTGPVQVGGELRIGVDGNVGNVTLSGGVGGDLLVSGDFTKNDDDSIGILNQNLREIVLNGSSPQSITGVNTFSLLAIDNLGSTVSIDQDLLISNRLRLSDGTFNTGSFLVTMDDNTELQRTFSGATISSEPAVTTGEVYNLSYLGIVTTGNEWSSDEDAVQDVYLNNDITLGNSRTLNRDLNMDGANIDLGGNTLRLKGRNTNAGQFAGDINISQPGERQINGSGVLLVNGEGGVDENARTKRVVSADGATLRISADTEMEIGNGGFDFGVGNPTTVDGELTVLGGGFVTGHSCFYSTNSLLRFTNGFDYQVNSGDLTWAQGGVGQAGVPYNVESTGSVSTDLTLNAPRTLANNLTIQNAIFTLTPSSGTFRIGGNWTRSGGDFVHNDQEVIFDGTAPTTQTINTLGGETFFELSFENDGTKTLSQDVTVLNNLNIRNGGNLDGGSSTIFLDGNWNNEIGASAFSESTSTVVFQGIAIQDIICPAGETFHNLEVNNSNIVALELDNDTRLSGTMSLINGIVRTQSSKLVVENGGTITGGSTDSYVDGILSKIGFTDQNEVLFPVGDYRQVTLDSLIDVYQPAGLLPFGTSSSAQFDVEYFHDNLTPGFTNPNNPPPTDASIETASTCNYWEIDRVQNGVNARVRLYWNNESCISVDESSFLRVAKWDGASWVNQFDTGINPNTGPAVSGDVISGTVSSFSPFTIASANPNLNILPITLLSFQAEAVDGVVRTAWVTASEINNDFFTVERSKDGSNWEAIGTVDGAGNSNTELSYSFLDDGPYAGISYYRLRQTDFDGTTTVSEPRAVEIKEGDAFGLDRVYHGQDGLNLVYRSAAPYLVVEIYDLLGKRVHGELLENYGNGFSTIHPDLARGAYILRLSHGSEMDAEKFVY